VKEGAFFHPVEIGFNLSHKQAALNRSIGKNDGAFFGLV
jgi:hypothetical protein